MTATETAPQAPAVPALLQLEITGLCNLSCTHCYSESSPKGTHGDMTAGDWEDVITQAAALGVRKAQFIGGEPMLHPALPQLIRHALVARLQVGVFSNLVHVSEELWQVLRSPGVTLACSWYAAGPEEHARITGSRAAWSATRRNISRAVRLGIPVRAAVIAMEAGQDMTAAEAVVRSLGVTQVSTRPVQGLGRAASDGADCDPAQLCGRCGVSSAAVLPDGTLAPCPMARWLGAGSVRDTPLGELLGGGAWREALAVIPRSATACQPDGDADNCSPDDESICPVKGGAGMPLTVMTR